MMNKREYYQQWKKVPHETSPSDISQKVVQKSGILNNHSQARTNYSKPAYLCANLTIVLVIVMLIGFDLHTSDKQGQERLTTNVLNLAQRASLSLQTTIFEKERKDLQ